MRYINRLFTYLVLLSPSMDHSCANSHLTQFIRFQIIIVFTSSVTDERTDGRWNENIMPPPVSMSSGEGIMMSDRAISLSVETGYLAAY